MILQKKDNNDIVRIAVVYAESLASIRCNQINDSEPARLTEVAATTLTPVKSEKDGGLFQGGCQEDHPPQ